MKVLVTGGTGFVGGAIVNALLKQGDEVRVFARRKSKTDHLRVQGVEIVYGDILDSSSIQNALKGCNVLYHAAALYDFWGLDEKELMQTEIDGTRGALEAALSSGVAKVVYTSTSTAVGEKRGEVGTETTTHRGYFLTMYERAKVEAEHVAMSFLDKGLPLVVVSPSGVYGPGDFKPTGRSIIHFLNGRMPGLFKASISLVYLDDVGIGHALGASKGKVGERYILSGDCVTMYEWASLISRLSGGRMPSTVPIFLASMTASFTEMVSRFTKQPPLLSKETFELISHGFQVDGTKAANELGIEYTPLEKGMRRTIGWYWEEGLLKRRPDCIVES